MPEAKKVPTYDVCIGGRPNDPAAAVACTVTTEAARDEIVAVLKKHAGALFQSDGFVFARSVVRDGEQQATEAAAPAEPAAPAVTPAKEPAGK